MDNLNDERDEELDHLRDRLLEADRELVRRWERVEAFRAALLRYGTHLGTCASLRRKEYALCDCGFAEVAR